MKKSEDFRRAKLEKLRAALARGEADIASGKATRLDSDEDVEAFFA